MVGDADTLVTCDVDLESDPQDWCLNNNDYTEWVVKQNGAPTGTSYWTDSSGSAVTAPVGAVKGRCEVPQCIPAEPVGVVATWG